MRGDDDRHGHRRRADQDRDSARARCDARSHRDAGSHRHRAGPDGHGVNLDQSEHDRSCPSCVAPAGFGVVSGIDASNDQAISTTTTGQTSGQTSVDPGTYPDVQVFTEGSWTMTITPSG